MSNFQNCIQHQHTLVNEINDRMFKHNMAVGNLDVLVNPRPESTLFKLPYESSLPPYNCMSHVLAYNSNSNTLTKSSRDYIININKESELKNMYTSLGRNPAKEFIPSGDSELFVKLPNIDYNHDFIPPPINLGNKLFNSSTRQNMKDN
tara:strand:- start:5628 stop:6074 length:447 start_codon:yes stop_codon:yes gene_type:complete